MSKSVNKAFGQACILSILASASIPLAPNFGGVNLYTPYVVIIPATIIAVVTWALQNGRVRLSGSARAYATVPALMFLLHFFGDDRTEQLNAILPYIFGVLVFFTILLILRFFSTSHVIVLKFAYFFFTLETLIATIQYFGHPEFGIISSYFGAGEERIVQFGNLVRISGTFGNPNVFSQVYQLMSALVVSDLLFSHKKPRFFSGLAVVTLTGIVIASSLSRSGLLFFIFVNLYILMVFFRREDRIKNKKIFFVALSVIILPVLAYIFSQKVLSLGFMRLINFEDALRLETYVGAIALLTDPGVLVFGVGADQFFQGAAQRGINFEYRSWVPPELMSSSVHNITLKMLTEFGLLLSIMYARAIIGFIYIGLTVTSPHHTRERMMFVIPLVFLFLIPFQLGTSGASIWLISIFSVYFAVIENYLWRVK